MKPPREWIADVLIVVTFVLFAINAGWVFWATVPPATALPPPGFVYGGMICFALSILIRGRLIP